MKLLWQTRMVLIITVTSIPGAESSSLTRATRQRCPVTPQPVPGTINHYNIITAGFLLNLFVEPFVTVLQKYGLYFKPICSPLFSLAVMVVIWRILSCYWCWSLLQTQRGSWAWGPGGRDLSVPPHARPRHPGDLAGGSRSSRSRRPESLDLHTAAASEQGPDHEGQQGDHEEAAGAGYLHREYYNPFPLQVMLHDDLKSRVLSGFVCFNFNWEQPRWCRIFAGSGIKINISARLLHNNTSAATPWPAQGLIWGSTGPADLETVLEPKSELMTFSMLVIFFCFCAQWKRERKRRCFDLLTRYPIYCTDLETCWENFSNYFVWELTNVYTLHRQL